MKLTCQECGVQTERAGQFARYCLGCSEAKSAARKAAWTEANRSRQRKYNRDVATALRPARKSAIIQAGKQLSVKEGISFDRPTPEFDWVVRFRVPFTQAVSKNHIYGLGHHVHKRKESRDIEQVIVLATKAAMRGITIAQNKLWVGLIVEKAHHKGDGINVVDLVCDALKVGVGLDDRWFCIDFLDWRINKNNPEIFIQLGQESAESLQACSHCGRLLPFSAFGKHKGNHNDLSRACKECRSLANAIVKRTVAGPSA